MGRNDRQINEIVSSINSLLLGRKLQGAGVEDIKQKDVNKFVDLISYSKTVADSVLNYNKSMLIANIIDKEEFFDGPFEFSLNSLIEPLKQLGGLMFERLQKVGVKEGLSEMVKSNELPEVIEGIAKLSMAEFLTALSIAIKEGLEDDKSKKEKKKEKKEEKKQEVNTEEEKTKEEHKKGGEQKKKKKVSHGRGTSKIISYLLEVKFYKEDDYNNSFNTFKDIYFTEDFYNKVAEEMTAHNEAQRVPKVPKGTRDSEPLSMVIKNHCIDTIKAVFKAHGAAEIDTPAFELKETLMGKYGEESKLIYDLTDQGGELLSLRYDLTVPFARYMALKKLTNFKRFHIGKIYRRDTPQISKGRYREFYQCDYDIAGAYSPMIAEAEILLIISEALKKLDLGDCSTIINHRGLLSAMVKLSGCEPTKFRAVCSSIDKLDKLSWEEVRSELIDIKGLTKEQADMIKSFTELKGKPRELLKRLNEEGQFAKHKEATEILKEIDLLADYLEALGVEDVIFDLSLARGLDYYTGLVYEVKLRDPKYSVGSIGGGGRYDDLIGMFAGKQIPAVGFSFGIERIFTILEDKLQGKMAPSSTKVLVASIGKGMVIEKMKICKELWNAGIEAELMYLDSPKPQKQISYALENAIPFMVWIGEQEVKDGMVKLKTMSTKDEVLIPRAEFITRTKELIAKM